MHASQQPAINAISPNSPRGGPKTRLGKQRARLNSLQHGLTATTLLPAILLPGRPDDFRERLLREFAPTTPAERILVDEIARHAAMLEMAEQAEGAVLRTGGVQMAHMAMASTQSEVEQHDTILAAATTSEALDRFTRYRRGHEKGLHAALAKLRELQSTRLALVKPAKRTSH